MNISRFALAALVAAALLVSASALSAQVSGRIRVALVGSLSAPSSRAEIIRFASPTERDIILLPAATASAADLAVALKAYRALQSRTPKEAGRVSRTSITAHDGSVRLAPESLRSAHAMLQRVRAAAESRIGNLGRGQWEEFDVHP